MGRKQQIVRSTSHGHDRAIAQIADRQHGNVTRWQLRAIGVTRDQIDHRIKIGRLHRAFRAVYAVGRPPKSPLEWAAAAVLACGPGALLSHRCALALWGLVQWPRAIDVTVPGDRRPKGIKVHRAANVIGRDRRTHQGIRVTSPARALLDSAPGLTDKALAHAFNDGRRAGLLGSNAIADVVERFPNHADARRLKRFIDATGGPTCAEWEDEFPAFCELYGLPKPLMCTRVAGYEVDAVFVEEKLIVELDGWGFHSDREAFESDRERDADTLAAGCHTVRITWARMHERPAKEAARLHEILRLWRAGGA